MVVEESDEFGDGELDGYTPASSSAGHGDDYEFEDGGLESRSEGPRNFTPESTSEGNSAELAGKGQQQE